MELDKQALDRWITGNWGEDQFLDDDYDEVEGVCNRCGQTEDKHTKIQVTNEADGFDYEDYKCPEPMEGA